MAEMIIVKSKIKEVAEDCNVSGDFAEALNEWAVQQVKRAGERAEANNRKTIQAKDVHVGSTETKEMLVVKSKVKNILENGESISGDFAEALNKVVVKAVSQASKRAKANGRKTIGSKDL